MASLKARVIQGTGWDYLFVKDLKTGLWIAFYLKAVQSPVGQDGRLPQWGSRRITEEFSSNPPQLISRQRSPLQKMIRSTTREISQKYFFSRRHPTLITPPHPTASRFPCCVLTWNTNWKIQMQNHENNNKCQLQKKKYWYRIFFGYRHTLVTRVWWVE